MTCRRVGLSLLEVIIAIAILVASTAVLGQLVYMGERQATKAELLTQAQGLCHNKINEIMAGLIPLEPVENESAAVDSPWDVTIQLEPMSGNGIVAVTVIVKEHTEQTSVTDTATSTPPLEFRLVRWLFQDNESSSAPSDDAFRANANPDADETTESNP